jgi:hypothetical protein
VKIRYWRRWRNLLRYGGMRPDRDWLQFDCALSYGLCEYLRTLKVLRTAGWSRARCIPHGGHQMSWNIAAGLGLSGNESYPDLRSWCRRIRCWPMPAASGTTSRMGPVRLRGVGMAVT